MKSTYWIKIILLLCVLGCKSPDPEPAAFEFKLFNSQGVESTSFRQGENITFSFLFRNTSNQTIRWKFLPDNQLYPSIQPVTKGQGILFDVYRDSSFAYSGRPYDQFVSYATNRIDEQISPESTIELRTNWQGLTESVKTFPSYGFSIAKNNNLPVGHYITAVAQTIEVNGVSKQIFLSKMFTIN